MLNCFITEETKNAIPITIIAQKKYSDWLTNQSESNQAWLQATQYKAEAGTMRILPDANGKIARIVCAVADENNFWGVGSLPLSLPEGVYQFDQNYPVGYSIAWGLGAYQFTRYKKPTRAPAQLVLAKNQVAEVTNMVEGTYLVRDWINTPTDDMGPTEFAAAAERFANHHGVRLHQTIGDDLLQKNYPSIYTVGRASDDAPRLLDLHWGDLNHPKVTLVGKGVCFDTGGLDLKPSSYMLLMKKDMGGGAHVFGLAHMIMTAKLPVRLRILVPVVENSVAGNAYRPGDVIKSRKGLTIEVGNTDAEGRVILADALTEAVNDKPDLLIDISTLTGAARVALGTELPAVFSNHDEVVNAVIKQGEKHYDPVWRLPLFPLYREYINSPIADLNNNSSEPYAGAITAALFLKEFVPDDVPWLHFDLMAWNIRAKPGKPQGGEAMGLRALFYYLQEKYQA